MQQGTTNAAISAGKKRGLHHAPYRATTVGASLFNGATLSLYVTFDTHQIMHCTCNTHFIHALEVLYLLTHSLTPYSNPLKPGETVDGRVEQTVSDVYKEIKSCAQEFNTRGDLSTGMLRG